MSLGVARRSLLRRMAFLFWAWAMCPSAGAEFYSGNDLKKWLDIYEAEQLSPGRWSTGQNAHQTGLYTGFVAGVFDTNVSVTFCSPSSMTLGQAMAVVAQYLKANPQRWHENAYFLVNDALVQSFPCKRR